MFGGPAARSAAETATLTEAGRDQADPGIRSAVGDAQTNVVDKGSTTRDIVAAPEGDGQSARATTPCRRSLTDPFVPGPDPGPTPSIPHNAKPTDPTPHHPRPASPRHPPGAS